MTEVWRGEQGQMWLQGAVTFDNAEAVYQQGLAWLRQQSAPQLVLDLSGLTVGNTLTLALIMRWLRQLRAPQQLQLRRVPPQLQSIIHASNLQVLLPAQG